MIRPIAISLSPNTELDDVKLATKALFSPNKWLDPSAVKKLENEFAKMFGGRAVFAVNSGRGAEYLILKALGIGKGDEVAIQAFTCVVVPNAILRTGAKPIYVDIGDDYNIDPSDLEKKITKNTKAVIVQHTFGLPAEMNQIKQLAKKKKILVIEDCAHCLGGKYKNSLLGTIGDVSFFSFGRDKMISSVFGGMILCSKKTFCKKLKKEAANLTNPPKFWIIQQLLHPIIFSAFVLPLYNLVLGRVILVLAQKAKILSKAVLEIEQECKWPDVFPRKMPSALSILAHNQLKKLAKFNKKRKRAAKIYYSALKDTDFILPPKTNQPLLRFPVRHKKAKSLYQYAKNHGVLLGNWYDNVVAPCQNLESVGYKAGSCPNAELFSKTVLNLPTYPVMHTREIYKVVDLIKRWLVTA